MYIWKAAAILGLGIAIATFLLPPHSQTGNSKNKVRDYAEICSDSVIRVATEYTASGFHVTQDSIAGFHYELVKAFANDNKLKAEMVPVMSFEDRIHGLLTGKYDLVATGIPTTTELKDQVRLTVPILLNRQILIQRKAETTDDTVFIQNRLQLAGRTLHVVKGSPATLRIQNLSDEIADTIYICEIEKYGQEQLIAMVAHGDIDYAVCDESIARHLCDSFPQIDTHMAISFTQLYAWAVNPKATALADTLNQWLKTFKETEQYDNMLNSYYGK